MKTAYLDCYSGVAGDMLLAALIDAGAPLAPIIDAIHSMGLTHVQISTVESCKKDFRCRQLVIDHPSEHAHRNLPIIEQMIDRANLSTKSLEIAKGMFRKIAAAEAKVHGHSIEQVHFHEVGAVDSICDIVGIAIAIDTLGIQKIVVSAVPTGCGQVRIAHGTVSIPAPATAELLRGIPIAQSSVQAELTTPTGAAAVAQLADSFGPLPDMVIEAIGYGGGSANFPEHANILRVIIGNSPKEPTVTAQLGVHDHDHDHDHDHEHSHSHDHDHSHSHDHDRSHDHDHSHDHDAHGEVEAPAETEQPQKIDVGMVKSEPMALATGTNSIRNRRLGPEASACGSELSGISPSQIEAPAECREVEAPAETRPFTFEPSDATSVDTIWVLETSLDDVKGETLGYVIERLWNCGAVDVYATAIQMKKNRPGVLLTVLAHQEQKAALLQILFDETTTLGVRCRLSDRAVLRREHVEVSTRWGIVRGKISWRSGKVDFSPEFDDCRQIASDAHMTLRDVTREVTACFESSFLPR